METCCMIWNEYIENIIFQNIQHCKQCFKKHCKDFYFGDILEK
jgi:hypothetical protein